jgi:hypothetical protein
LPCKRRKHIFAHCESFFRKGKHQECKKSVLMFFFKVWKFLFGIKE